MIRFSKHKGETWQEVLEGDDRQYAEWAVENAKKMGADLRATLMEALAEPVDSPTSEGEAETRDEDGTTTGPPANKGQLAALRRVYGAIVLEAGPKERALIEGVLADEGSSEQVVTDWISWCDAFKADLDKEREA